MTKPKSNYIRQFLIYGHLKNKNIFQWEVSCTDVKEPEVSDIEDDPPLSQFENFGTPLPIQGKENQNIISVIPERWPKKLMHLWENNIIRTKKKCDAEIAVSSRSRA